MNISSIVVKTHPDRLAQVMEGLREIETCDIHFSDEQGRIVVTVEGTDDADETAKLKRIQALPGVASADFSYTYNDHEAHATEE
ncbi:MAG: chaperone NapD [bacterium]|nr:chaperone NapD [bacterium]